MEHFTFVLYYGKAFGFENISIIDNGLIDMDVLKVYKIYMALGVSAVREHGYETRTAPQAW